MKANGDKATAIKSYTIRADARLWRRFEMAATLNGKTIKDILTGAIEEYTAANLPESWQEIIEERAN